MKSLRILAVACATFFVTSFAHAQIKAGASSVGVYGLVQKPSSGDLSGSAFVTYDYFMTDTISLSLLGGGFFSKGSNVGIGSANISFYLSRDKVAPYVGFGGGYAGGSGGGGSGTYRGYVGFESFISERTSLDSRVSYEKSTSGGGGGNWQATIGFKIYLN